MSTDTAEGATGGPSLWRAVWPAILVVATAVALYSGAMFWLLPGDEDPDGGYGKRGQFGDMYGFLTALFSGVALAAVAIQIHLQRTEIANNANALSGEAAAVRELTVALRAATAASVEAARASATLEMVDQFATMMLEHPAGHTHDAALDLNRDRVNENFLMKVRRTQALMRMAALSGEIGPDYEQIRSRFLRRAQVYFEATAGGLGSLTEDFGKDQNDAAPA